MPQSPKLPTVSYMAVEDEDQTKERPSKGPWILVGIVLVIQIIVWTAFVWFAEEHKPESIPVEANGTPPESE